MSKKQNLVNDGIILIGFGEKSLADLLEEVKDDPEKMHELAYLSIKEVPHYRTFTACTIKQQEAFLEYMEAMKAYVGDEINE